MSKKKYNSARDLKACLPNLPLKTGKAKKKIKVFFITRMSADPCRRTEKTAPRQRSRSPENLHGSASGIYAIFCCTCMDWQTRVWRFWQQISFYILSRESGQCCYLGER
jgi:hypothetical protein